MYIGLELPTEEKAFEMKKERAILINDSMDYIAERSWLLLRHTEPPISKESFENQVTQTWNSFLFQQGISKSNNLETG